ncbi:GPW/gp25 family protein [Rugamonas apoptosis]|uniref:GPW/gp25 family protein n=1 Tax=Rugamonas apoptosis TaxID=2758570 RepID=A0A7W2ILM4_9BURK|nr:GPW/gp25 family protein [Rugamonas apoptosis]MBA5688714.1 GPW/gp25 family protein [Rugamonas apoptosis]
MTGFSSSIWVRLTEPPHTSTGRHHAMRPRAIARDLESLLNTRATPPDKQLATLPLCRGSILNFGLTDFAQLRPSDSADRKKRCDSLKTIPHQNWGAAMS